MRRIAGAFAVLLTAGFIGFWSYRLANPPHASPTRATPPSTVERPDRRSIPERLPDLTLTDRDGKPRRLSEWAGRPVLVNFWATWCAPCRREIPLLKRLRAERAPQRLEVIGIAIDFRDAVLEYAREIGLDYPLLIGEQDGLDAAAAFGMDVVLPFSIFADSQGRIVTVKVGELTADEAGFILDAMRDVDAGRLDLTQARQRIAARLKQRAVERAKQN